MEGTMNKSLLTLLVTSLVLSACASDNAQNTSSQTAKNTAPTEAIKNGVQEDSALIQRAKTHVSGLLVKPDSAMFKNIVQKAPNVVCGEINGKSKDGEYTQFTPFYYQEKNGKIFSRIASEDRLNRVLFNSIYRVRCK